MAFLKHFLIYSVCAAALVIAVYATGEKCVSCNDHTTCNDPLNTTVANITCTLKDKEVCGMISYNDTVGKLTIRGCVDSSVSCNDAKELAAGAGLLKDNGTWTCYTCTGELCNKESSGNSFGVPMVALVLGAMASLYFK